MNLFEKNIPATAMAPMQDVNDASFLKIIAEYGAPNIFFAEYFRVHEHSSLDKPVLDAVLSKPKNTPVCAQFIGENIFDLRRVANLLSAYEDVEFLDFNMGCPAPKVYRKNVGGGLLKEPKKIREILFALRDSWKKTLSVKLRIGFENKDSFFEILEIINESGVDFASLHGRTVKQLYRGDVDYEAIKQAAEFLKIPLFANGDLKTAKKALEVANYTKAKGVMIGRHVIRNPWIFRQISELKNNQEMFKPTLSDVFSYIYKIYTMTISENPNIKKADGRLKKFLNFIAVSVDEDGAFLNEMRHTIGLAPLMKVCEKHLLSKPDKFYSDEPYPTLCARPNHEN